MLLEATKKRIIYPELVCNKRDMPSLLERKFIRHNSFMVLIWLPIQYVMYYDVISAAGRAVSVTLLSFATLLVASGTTIGVLVAGAGISLRFNPAISNSWIRSRVAARPCSIPNPSHLPAAKRYLFFYREDSPGRRIRKPFQHP